MNPTNRLIELTELLKYHDRLYFLEDRSEISDHEYDALKKEFNDILAEHPELQQLDTRTTPVNLEIQDSRLQKVKHETQMASIENVFNLEEIDEFKSRFPDDTAYVYEHKNDGIAVDLRYEDGQLVRIATRGDGFIGEDITHNLPLFINIPQQLDAGGTNTIRGEGVISNEMFARLQAFSAKPYKSARNAASGLLRSLTVHEDLYGLIDFIPYDLESDTIEYDTYEHMIDEVVALGFTRPEPAGLNHILTGMRSNKYPTDGIVIKVNDIELRHTAGSTLHHPRWLTAYKYPAEIKETELLDVVFQTGRTGVVTPVAVYKPVIFGGIENTRATLHNYKQFAKHKLRRGSIVKVCRSADVIPYFMEVVKEGNGTIIKFPRSCESCGEPLRYDGNDHEQTFMVCENHAGCPAQRSGRFYMFADRDGLNIIGLGKVTVDYLVANNFVTEYADLFKLERYRDQIDPTVVSPLVLDKLIKSAERSKRVEINKVIKALGLPNIGVANAKTIAKELSSGDELIPLLKDADRMKELPGIEWATAMMVGNELYENDGALEQEITNLLKVLNIIYIEGGEEYKQICISGKFSIPRDAIKALLLPKGYELVKSVTKDTVGLIIGYDHSEGKVIKATKYEQPIVDLSGLPELSIREALDKSF